MSLKEVRETLTTGGEKIDHELLTHTELSVSSVKQLFADFEVAIWNLMKQNPCVPEGEIRLCVWNIMQSYPYAWMRAEGRQDLFVEAMRQEAEYYVDAAKSFEETDKLKKD